MLTREHPNRKFLPTLERREPLIMDHSATKIYKECPRKYFYRIVVGRKLVNPALKVIFDWGNSIHMFMEVLYEYGDFQRAFTAALKIYSAPPPDSKWKHLDITRLGQSCKLLYEFYQKEVELGQVEIKGIEQPFNITLPDGTQIGGRFDQIFTRNGRLLVRDWKTTTKQTSWFLPALNPNDQATRYAYAASRLAGWSRENPGKGKIDGIEFVVIENQSPTKSDNKAPKLSTNLIPKSIHELLQWEEEQMFIYKQMELNRLHDVWPMHENNCNWCDYRSVCRQQTDGSREWELKSNYAVDFWDHTRETKGDD